MKKLFILLISLINMQLIAMEQPIEEDLDSYYIYYNFKKVEHPRQFHYMIEPYEPCIQSFNDLENLTHPHNITSKIFPLKLFLTENFFNNPELKLIAHEKNTHDYREHHFYFYTKTGESIKKVIEEKIKLFEENCPFAPSRWFGSGKKNPPFEKYATELLDAQIIEIDKKYFNYIHGPKSWVVKMKEEKKAKEAAAIAKFLEEKNNVVHNRLIDRCTRNTQLVHIAYLLTFVRT